MKKIIPFAVACMLLLPDCKKDKKMTTPTITTTAASGVTGSSVQTGGNITDDGGSQITKRGICWAIHSNPTVSDSITSNGTGSGSFTVTLNNLSANTTYYIKAYAINSTGTSYGNEVSIKTAAGLATVTTAAITNLQPLSAVSGGNITNDGGASITERGVVYATSANPTLTNYKIVAGTGTGIFTATLSPLASQQTYYARAYATNSNGTAYGNQVQFNAASANTVTDVEGNVYPYVTLCGKSWMATNLKTTKYKNGDPITNGYATANFDWAHTSTGAYTFPNSMTSNKDTFGLLYNLYVINDSRGVCPTGWHVPSDDEWKALEICEGMSAADADLDGYRGTIAPAFEVGGSSGLNMQLAGYLLPSDGTTYGWGTRGYFYSSTPVTSISNWFRAVPDPNDGNYPGVRRLYNSYGMSVRCIKD